MKPDPREEFQRHFGHPAQHVGIAPGRIELIGNHTDYNEGLVMGVAIDRTVRVAVAARDEPEFRIVSGRDRVTVDSGGRLVPLSGDDAWANYPLGIIDQLRKIGIDLPAGLEIAVTSDLPTGAGLSSSAAFELATAQALLALCGHELPKRELARLGRRAENDFVGVPCGILDQAVSTYGIRDHLVAIDCRTEEARTLPVPATVAFWTFGSGVQHALVESAYATRVKECHEAVKRLQARFPKATALRDISSDQLTTAADLLDDTLLRRARHVVSENERVLAVEDALKRDDLTAVGRALRASHESSRTDYENSVEELDFLVDRLMTTRGVLGARLTGGGFGGAALAMTTGDFGPAEAAAVAADYRETYGTATESIRMFASDGARQG